jgi:UPF0176 protein
MSITVATFYEFTPIAQPASHKPALLARMREVGIRGTLTLATEGVNATLSGEAEAMARYLHELQQRFGLRFAMQRFSTTDAQPFQRSKVKVKRELISIGAEANPAMCVGEYVAPEDWNALISEPGVITIDTRNAYEFSIGHFAGAVNPDTRTFKQMLAFTEAELAPRGLDRPVAMYCTGGIRCEKYSAYMLSLGFTRIYHLKGGILAYLEQVPEAQSLWRGSCFVFDERVALGHGLTPAAAATILAAPVAL